MRTYRSRTIVRERIVCKPGRPGVSRDQGSLILPSEHRLQVLRGKLRSDARHRNSCHRIQLLRLVRRHECTRALKGDEKREHERTEQNSVCMRNANDIHRGNIPKERERKRKRKRESSHLSPQHVLSAQERLCLHSCSVYIHPGIPPSGITCVWRDIRGLGKGRRYAGRLFSVSPRESVRNT